MTELTSHEERVNEVKTRPSFSIDHFEKVQRSLLNDLESKLILLEAEYGEKIERHAQFYDTEVASLNARIEDWTKLISDARAGVKELLEDKRKALEVLEKERAKQVDAQQRMIKFQRQGLEGLRA